MARTQTRMLSAGSPACSCAHMRAGGLLLAISRFPSGGLCPFAFPMAMCASGCGPFAHGPADSLWPPFIVLASPVTQESQRCCYVVVLRAFTHLLVFKFFFNVCF